MNNIKMKDMKVCITSSGPNLDSSVDPRFGRCLYFIFVDDKEKIDVVSNAGVKAMSGAGIQAAQTVVNQGAKIVITGNVGPKALSVLMTSGIKIFQVRSEVKIAEALTAFKQGQLPEITQPFGSGFGPGGGRGQGLGRGRRGGGLR